MAGCAVILAEDLSRAEHGRRLVERFQAGDVDAFGELYRLHQPIVFASLYTKCRDRCLAEDLTQTVFVRAWDGLARWQWQGKDAVAYLKTIGSNLLTDHRKSLRERMTTDSPEAVEHAMVTVADDDPGPEDTAVRRVVGRALAAAMQELTADQREILRLRFLDGMSVREVVAATGRSYPAVVSTSFRAIAALRRRLDLEAVSGDA